jgi:hypothetical protein
MDRNKNLTQSRKARKGVIGDSSSRDQQPTVGGTDLKKYLSTLNEK